MNNEEFTERITAAMLGEPAVAKMVTGDYPELLREAWNMVPPLEPLRVDPEHLVIVGLSPLRVITGQEWEREGKPAIYGPVVPGYAESLEALAEPPYSLPPARAAERIGILGPNPGDGTVRAARTVKALLDSFDLMQVPVEEIMGHPEHPAPDLDPPQPVGDDSWVQRGFIQVRQADWVRLADITRVSFNTGPGPDECAIALHEEWVTLSDQEARDFWVAWTQYLAGDE